LKRVAGERGRPLHALMVVVVVVVVVMFTSVQL